MKVCITCMVLVFLTHSLTSDPDLGCCKTRKVGSFTYNLLRDQVAREFPTECHDRCAYTRDGEDASPDYCFKPGSLSSSCVGDNNEVSCGAHVASSCALCPGKHGKAWCNGDCQWESNTCKPKTRQGTQGLLITGGRWKGKISNVSVYPESGFLPSSCSLPPLVNPRSDHTATVLSSVVYLCGGLANSDSISQSCEKLTAKGWERHGSLSEERWYHSTHALNNKILVVGGTGRDTAKTSEYIDIQGKNHPGPVISPGRRGHCGITLDSSTILLIGGSKYDDADNKVTLLKGLHTVQSLQPESEDLPPLNVGRWLHACGTYSKDGKMVIVVTGGDDDYDDYGDESNRKSSTEIFIYPGGSSWKTSLGGKLPSPMYALRGNTINGKFIIAGKYPTEVLVWSPEEESWEKTGYKMTQSYSGVVGVNVKNLYC